MLYYCIGELVDRQQSFQPRQVENLQEKRQIHSSVFYNSTESSGPSAVSLYKYNIGDFAQMTSTFIADWTDLCFKMSIGRWSENRFFTKVSPLEVDISDHTKLPTAGC